MIPTIVLKGYTSFMSSMFGARIMSIIPMIWKQKECIRQINNHPDRNRRNRDNREYELGTFQEKTRPNNAKTVRKATGMFSYASLGSQVSV